jgi:hypothetical protein
MKANLSHSFGKKFREGLAALAGDCNPKAAAIVSNAA